MSFAENLKETRKRNQMSQEELAEMLGVSRQAVSRWELGDGYPEVEKIIILGEKLNVSLDYLLLDKKESNVAGSDSEKLQTPSKSIRITSPNEGVIVDTSFVARSQEFKGSKNSPKYALFASEKSTSIFGPQNRFLSWYRDIEDITKEIEEINQAMDKGEASYTLKHSVKCKRKLLKVEME